MATDNNRTSIVRSLKQSWYKYKNSHLTRKIYQITGELPDHWTSNYMGKITDEKPEYTEDQLIKESLTNPNHIF